MLNCVLPCLKQILPWPFILNCIIYYKYQFLSSAPIPVTPEPQMKRPNHLDIMSPTNYNFRKSPSVSNWLHLFTLILLIINSHFRITKIGQYRAHPSIRSPPTHLPQQHRRPPKSYSKCANRSNSKRCRHDRRWRSSWCCAISSSPRRTLASRLKYEIAVWIWII